MFYNSLPVVLLTVFVGTVLSLVDCVFLLLWAAIYRKQFYVSNDGIFITASSVCSGLCILKTKQWLWCQHVYHFSPGNIFLALGSDLLGVSNSYKATAVW